MELQQNIGFKLVDHFSSGSELSEEPELDEWYKLSEEHKIIYQNFRKIWQGTTELAYTRKFNAEKAWVLVNGKISATDTTRIRLNNILYAVIGMAASLLITVGLAFYTNVFSPKGETVQLSTNFGSRSSLVLPDGTHVTLNAGTNLEYRFNSFNEVREVKFRGEGFFEVAKSKNPFIIQTSNGLKLKVLGTKFNLKAYSEENTIKTSLVEGKIELNSLDNKTLELLPGQIAIYNDRTKDLNYSNGQVNQDIGWLNNKLYLDKTSLQEVCIILERRYDVKIVITKDGLGNKIHYTGVLMEETIMDVLDALCKLSEIKYQIKGKNITINNKDCLWRDEN